MIRKERKLSEIVRGMKSLGNMLVPYNYPLSLSSFFDDDLEIFKERESCIDGYYLVIHYQKSFYGSYFVETLQVYNNKGPFLPFNLVKKIAVKFLGIEKLSLVEFFKNGKKIYCWTLSTDINNKPIDPPYEAEGTLCNFEDFTYFYLKPSYVNFY